MGGEEKIKILKAVANEKRIAILKLLQKNKRLSVGDLAEMTDCPFRSVSKDLGILKKAGIVESCTHLSERIYSINTDNFPKELFHFLAE